MTYFMIFLSSIFVQRNLIPTELSFLVLMVFKTINTKFLSVNGIQNCSRPPSPVQANASYYTFAFINCQSHMGIVQRKKL
jgi:hypothetical protein